LSEYSIGSKVYMPRISWYDASLLLFEQPENFVMSNVSNLYDLGVVTAFISSRPASGITATTNVTQVSKPVLVTPSQPLLLPKPTVQQVMVKKVTISKLFLPYFSTQCILAIRQQIKNT